MNIVIGLESQDTLKATLNGVCVGRCRFFRNRWHYHPRIYSLAFSDLAEDNVTAVVAGLYRKVVEVLQPKPLLFRTGVREDDPIREALGPLGFREYRRVYEPVFEVEAFDLGHLAEVTAEFERLGYRLVRLTDLEWTDEVEQRFYEMYNEIYADTSTAMPATPERLSREGWFEQVLQSEDVIPEAFFIAIHGDAFAGFGNLLKGEREGELETGPFGTMRAFRHHHREIMLTIKAREIAYAKARGYRTIRAEIDAENPWLLHICAELPFVQGKDYLSLVRVLNWTVK